VGQRALPRITDLFIAVPDGELASVAASLKAPSWEGVWVAHMSGALTARELDSLRERGAITCSFHPMQSFLRERISSFSGIYIGVEGDPEAVARAVWWAERLGARAVLVPPEAKGLYHIAGILASNYLIALLGVAQEVLAGLDVRGERAFALLQPLVRGALENAEALGDPERALSGPIRRGDVLTLQRHGQVLAERLPHLIPLYVAMGIETVRIAVRKGYLEPERAQAVLAELERILRWDPSEESLP